MQVLAGLNVVRQIGFWQIILDVVRRIGFWPRKASGVGRVQCVLGEGVGPREWGVDRTWPRMGCWGGPVGSERGDGEVWVVPCVSYSGNVYTMSCISSMQMEEIYIRSVPWRP